MKKEVFFVIYFSLVFADKLSSKLDRGERAERDEKDF